MRPPARILILAGALMLLAVVYPLAVEAVLDRWGPRWVGGALALIGAVSAGALVRAPALPGLPPSVRLGLLALPLLAALTGEALFLRLVPVAIQALLVAVFLASLRGGGSILQDAARRIHPYAPDFIAPYCRQVTRIFAAIFAVQALAVAALAVAPPASGWALATGVGVWIPIALASLVEWIVRKSWFRYYGEGPVDRLLRTWLPPEATAPGRRSLEYVRRKRRELGMPPP